MRTVRSQMVITGVVQGVGYRYYCYRRALSLGLTGWVRNEPDGSVTALAEGDRSLVEQFITDLKVGPPSASVTDIKITWSTFGGEFSRFDIRMH
ncbi:MAG: acylphosphatase [bacterium]